MNSLDIGKFENLQSLLQQTIDIYRSAMAAIAGLDCSATIIDELASTQQQHQAMLTSVNALLDCLHDNNTVELTQLQKDMLTMARSSREHLIQTRQHYAEAIQGTDHEQLLGWLKQLQKTDDLLSKVMDDVMSSFDAEDACKPELTEIRDRL